MSKEYKWQIQKLKQLARALYDYSVVDYDERANFQIFFGTGAGLIEKFSLKSNVFRTRLEKLFLHTFTDKDVVFQENKRNTDARTVKKNALMYFLSEDELEKIIEQCSTRSYKKYIPTVQSIFDVMENYDSFQGVPIICTEEQLEECMKEYGNRYISNSFGEQPDNEHKRSTLKKFIRSNSDVIDTLSAYIYTLLVDELLPIFWNKDMTDEKQLELQYSQAYDSIQAQLKDKFMEEVSRKICSDEQVSEDIVNQMILVDPNYKFDMPEMRVIYCPERSPILTDWHIPEHQYITYQKPALRHENVKNYVSCLVRNASDPYGIIQIDPDKPMLQFPISDKTVKYQQGIFQNFQIIYLTFANNPRYTVSAFEYLGPQDDFISDDIMKREQATIASYWKSVFESLTDMLRRIFTYSVDFTDLIKEQSEKDMINTWKKLFCQKELLIHDKNTFSAFVSQDLIIRHYLLQWSSTIPAYRDMMGDDYITEVSIRQLAYVMIPLIGEFVSELKENAVKIADAARTMMTVSEFQGHLREIKCYLSETNLDRAIDQWNESYEAVKRRCANQFRLAAKPDDDLLGLRSYADSNGNLFQNLKDVLELYRGYLENAINT